MMHWPLFITAAIAALDDVEAFKSPVPTKLKAITNLPPSQFISLDGGSEKLRGSSNLIGSLNKQVALAIANPEGCLCGEVVFSSGSGRQGDLRITPTPNQMADWWCGGGTADAGIICTDGMHFKDWMYILVKYRDGSRKRRIYFKVSSTETTIRWSQKIRRWKKQKPIKMEDIYTFVGLKVIQFHSPKNREKLWGLVDSDGLVQCFGRPDQFIEFINRMFLHSLVKLYIVGKGYEVYQLKLKWLSGKYKRIAIPAAPDLWLIPVWLPKPQRKVVWQVVIYHGTIYKVIYIGVNENLGISKIIIWVRGRRPFIYQVRIEEFLILFREKVRGKYLDWRRGAVLGEISKQLGLSIIHWPYYRAMGEPPGLYWGLVNKKGEIVAYGEYGEVGHKVYVETITRLYCLYLLKERVIAKGHTVLSYEIIWEGVSQGRIPFENVEITTLLLPTWLEAQYQGSIWIVVKHMTKIVVVFVGSGVTGPQITGCGGDDDPYNSKEYDDDDDDDDDKDFGECEWGNVTNVPGIGRPRKPRWCKALNLWGRCVDQVGTDDDGMCGCMETCHCVNPYGLWQRETKATDSVVLTTEQVRAGGTPPAIIEN